MRRKLISILIVCFSVIAIFFVFSNMPTAIPEASTSNSTNSDSSSVGSKSTVTHYCDADGCSRIGTKSYSGVSGEVEWYCQEHYDEMMDIIGMMEKDVGKGTASRHTCEVCSKEGTHSIIGLSGETEYYCTEHYNEMSEILEALSEY